MKDGRLVANGGRVLNVTALGRDVARRRERAYRAVESDRLAGRLLPAGHRLAGAGALNGLACFRPRYFFSVCAA